jgi:hypothetical protein
MGGLFRRWQTEVGDAYVLGLVRVAIGCFLFWHALGSARALETEGYFGDAFHMPIVAEAWVPSRIVYTFVAAARVLLAVLVAVGYVPRLALLGSAALGVYTLVCDRTGYHHNRYALDCFAFLLAFAPCDRSFVITGTPRDAAARVAPLWAQRLMQIQLSIIYISSGGSKLLDDDWRNGAVIFDRFARYAYQAIDRGVPRGLVDFLSQPAMTSTLAKLAIATELFLSIALWMRRTRVFALWWGTCFHLTIEVTSQVEIFTWLTLTIYALFATPDVAARKLFFDPSRAKGIVLSRLVVWLDWLARFEVKAWEPDDLKKGHVIVIVRRDGSRATGVRALAMVARCVPLLFPLWAPIALVASFTKGGEASARA